MVEVKKDIFDAEYTEQVFQDLVALNIKVRSCIFDSCTFKNCNFSAIDLQNTTFVGCKFTNSKILGIDWSVLNQSMGFDNTFTKCDLSYSVFLNNDLRGMELRDCKLIESSFENCNMKKCIFRECDLEGTRFFKNDLTECDFTHSVNYLLDISENVCKKAKFSSPEVLNLLRVKGLDVD